jgi:hypothetical protein
MCDPTQGTFFEPESFTPAIIPFLRGGVGKIASGGTLIAA